MPGRLEIAGRLTIADPSGATITMHGQGDTVVVDAPSLKALKGLRSLQATPPIRDAIHAGAASRVAPEVQLRVRGSTVAVMGADVVPDVIARVLRLGPLRIKPLRLLRAACGLA